MTDLPFVSALVQADLPVWEQCLQTEFLQKMENGILSEDCFKSYLVEDSLYLREYAKIFAWGMTKATTMAAMRTYYSLLSFVYTHGLPASFRRSSRAMPQSFSLKAESTADRSLLRFFVRLWTATVRWSRKYDKFYRIYTICNEKPLLKSKNCAIIRIDPREKRREKYERENDTNGFIYDTRRRNKGRLF